MWRLLDHGPSPPAWNMALDEVLRRSHAEAGGPSPEGSLPVTSLEEILGAVPLLPAVKQALQRGLEEELGIMLTPGDFTLWERKALERDYAQALGQAALAGRPAPGVS